MSIEGFVKTSAKRRFAASSLQSRTLIFLISLSSLSIFGVWLMGTSIDRIGTSTAQIQEHLLPMGRGLETIARELELQIYQVNLLTLQESPSTPQSSNLPAQLRLPNSMRQIAEERSVRDFPPEIEAVAQSWFDAITQYQGRVSLIKKPSELLPALRELRTKTDLLHRAVERELSVNLLSVVDTTRHHLWIWSSLLLVGILSALGFIFLMWRWTEPLVKMEYWLESFLKDAEPNLARRPLPPSAIGSGLFSAPLEFQSLLESVRDVIGHLKDQAIELEDRSGRIRETERAFGTIFAALQHLTRHNEHLIEELVKREKLASMSEVAAQLAHEIRNPLNSLSLKIELLREELPLAQQEKLDKVLLEIDRLDALTEGYLRSTRERLRTSTSMISQKTPEASRFEYIILDAMETLRPEIESAGLALSVVMDPDVRKMSSTVPHNVLKAALINFLKNAKDAMVTETKDNQPSSIELDLSRVGEQHWKISVRDYGCGFSDEFLKTGLVSFQTSKANGSGLGLVTSKKMLEAYGVNLSIRSMSQNGAGDGSGWTTEISLVGEFHPTRSTHPEVSA